MGTNYYLMRKDFKEIYDKMDKNEKEYYWEKLIHKVGKSSAGWKFLFQYCNLFQSFDDLMRLLSSEKYILLNEYEETISKLEFFNLVESKQCSQSHRGLDPDLYEINNYDFIRGEFH